jgi:hypothetical protein
VTSPEGCADDDGRVPAAHARHADRRALRGQGRQLPRLRPLVRRERPPGRHRCQEVVSGLFYLLEPPDWASGRIGLAGISVFVTPEDARARARENLLAEVVADLHRLVDELGLPEHELVETVRERYRAAG